MYMQMGGNAGSATWARTNGALAAGEAFGIKIIEQYSAWQPEKCWSSSGRRSRQSRLHRDHGPPGQ